MLPAYPEGVCFGAVTHRRRHPREHDFRYPVASLRVALSGLGELRVPWLGINRRNVFSLRFLDYGPRDGSDLEPWIRGLLGRHGLGEACDGEVLLQTFPRLLGYAFNPVSFWLCHDRVGRLRAVLAEVNNTFGEHHSYLLHRDDRGPIASGEELCARKCFHVSPFLPVRGEYRFRFEFTPDAQAVAIDYFDAGTRMLSTRIGGRLALLDGGSMRRWMARYPLMTCAVIARIHLQALRLWCKQTPFHRKPLPPLEEISR